MTLSTFHFAATSAYMQSWRKSNNKKNSGYGSVDADYDDYLDRNPDGCDDE